MVNTPLNRIPKPNQSTLPPAGDVPIPDINNNQILDGEDILTALRFEEEAGDARTTNERAHGVIETMELRDLTAEIIDRQRQGIYLTNGEAEVLAADISHELGKAASLFGQTVKNDPQFREDMIEMSRKDAVEAKKSPLHVAIDVADRANFMDFSESFATTFPKGVAIDSESLKEILGHFTTPKIEAAPAETKPRLTR